MLTFEIKHRRLLSLSFILIFALSAIAQQTRIEQTVAMLNMDMIGRMRDSKLIIGGVGTAKEWRAFVEAANTVQGISVDANSKRPTYTVARSEATGRTMGFRVYLGTIPNYSDSNDGVLLDGIRDDSPAAKAGLKAGDRIIRLAGREVHNVYDYTYALGEMKAGQEYEIEVVRGSEHLKLKIIPAARR